MTVSYEEIHHGQQVTHFVQFLPALNRKKLFQKISFFLMEDDMEHVGNDLGI